MQPGFQVHALYCICKLQINGIARYYVSGEETSINLNVSKPVYWQHTFLYFHYKSVNLMFCVDKIKYEHLAILSNLKSCQFAPRIVIFNLCICCQFEDSQIILPNIIPNKIICVMR